MLRWRHLLLLCTVAHFTVALGIFLWSYGVSSDAFEGKSVSWLERHLVSPLAELLWFPANFFFAQERVAGLRLPPLGQWAVLVANSMLWGALLAALIRRIYSPAKRQK